MNKFFQILFAATIAITVMACEEDEANSVAQAVTNPSSLLPEMTANVDSLSWTATTSPGAVFFVDSNLIAITGFDSTMNSTILLRVKNPVANTTYDLADSTSGATASYKFSNLIKSGSVSITNFTLETVISGSFSFETDSSLLSSNYVITNGVFKNVPIVKQ